jgi:hypothetical protein
MDLQVVKIKLTKGYAQWIHEKKFIFEILFAITQI